MTTDWREAAEERAVPGLAELVANLPEGLGRLTDDVTGRILQADPAYRDLVPLEELRESVRVNLAQLLDRLCVPTSPTHGYLGFIADLAERRVAQGLPLSSLLRGFRLGALRIWDALREEAQRDPGVSSTVLVEAAGLMWALHDTTCNRVEQAYRRAEQDGIADHVAHRGRLLAQLLEGRSPRPDHIASQLGLGGAGRVAVVVLEGIASASPDAEAHLADGGLRSAWRREPPGATGLVALGDRSLEDLAASLRGLPGQRAGVSLVIDDLADLPQARRQAHAALATIPPDRAGVAVLEWDLAAALLATAPDIALLMRDRLLGAVLDLEEAERSLMLSTLEAYAASGASATVTAKVVACHRNTVLNRIRRYEQLSGRSLDTPEALLTTWLAARAHALVAG